MAKRGRPRKFGRQPVWMLGRRILVLQAFNNARRNGLKYIAAIWAAIDAVKAQYPDVRIGPRRVKGILAEWQPKESSRVLTVSNVSNSEFQSPEMQRNFEIFHSMGWPKDRKVKAFTIGLGPRPQHPRINAKAQQGASERRR